MIERLKGIRLLWDAYSNFASHEVALGVSGIYWRGRERFTDQQDYYSAAIGLQYLMGDAELLAGSGLLVAALRSRSPLIRTAGLLLGAGLIATGTSHIWDSNKASSMLDQELSTKTVA